MNQNWQQGQILTLEITDLNDQGEGVGRFEERVVFVSDTVPGDRIHVRLIRVKPSYAYGKLLTIITPSKHRIKPPCILAENCGGCQWQHIDYNYQLIAKQNQISQALMRLGGFDNPPVQATQFSSQSLGYRNKVTYPLGVNLTGEIKAGFYEKHSHKIVNLNQCPVQDQTFNILLKKIKQDIKNQGWSIYNEQTQKGQLRYLGLRIGRRTGEVLITLVTTGLELTQLEGQAQQWQQDYPQVVGVCVHVNPRPGNAILGGKTYCIWGRDYLWEEFCGLRWQIRPDTFFQVHTEQAEALIDYLKMNLNLQGGELLLDAYCGLGTLSLPLAQYVQKIIGLEVQPAAIKQAEFNAEINGIQNAEFHCGTVEELLPKLNLKPNIILLDPPRKGCDPSVIDFLAKHPVDRLVYVSCNPATLARDLQQLCAHQSYVLEQVMPFDFFPQTHHVESISFLRRSF
ncbi:23S rRNA methyltransferase/RumA [Gloeomargarita lithophora Alchichica-D10]|uniref:23S rRNA methyltransferase/RumA n=1 Tax=Gloeomargarita lithophora Alchichica-D10 TaxID=1188229 RepID=A0A1J0AEP5_9CYAN|nr:23S rRNA (uracil(1939)-C(5))-methyltransferase RlmD [Gloeomargarita lithophora]APB34422.1 23S rRNA methyltransferase/RumA [Gloeomargarita lithophora Alchichica-D10]